MFKIRVSLIRLTVKLDLWNPFLKYAFCRLYIDQDLLSYARASWCFIRQRILNSILMSKQINLQDVASHLFVSRFITNSWCKLLSLRGPNVLDVKSDPKQLRCLLHVECQHVEANWVNQNKSQHNENTSHESGPTNSDPWSNPWYWKRSRYDKTSYI